MNLAAPKQDNRVSVSCEMLHHEACSGSYPTLRTEEATTCHCACHAFREARPQLVRLLNDIDTYLGAAEPSQAQGEQGGDGNPRQDFTPLASASLYATAGQRQATPSGDRAEGSAHNPPETTDPAGTRSPASSLEELTVRICTGCRAVFQRFPSESSSCSACGNFLGKAMTWRIDVL